MEYKGVRILLNEGNVIKSGEYSVSAFESLVFWASCKYGDVFTLHSEQAIADIKALIDRRLAN